MEEKRDKIQTVTPVINCNKKKRKFNCATAMNVLKTMLGIMLPHSEDGPGDCYHQRDDDDGDCWRRPKSFWKRHTMWDDEPQPHPSHEGHRPITAEQYWYGRKVMGFRHPHFDYLRASRSRFKPEDEEILIEIRQPKPIFPDPHDLHWPTLRHLTISMPEKYHRFLKPDYKKDCRVWLWKNWEGRVIRERLEELRAPPRMRMISSSYFQSPHDHEHGHKKDSPNWKAVSEKRERKSKEKEKELANNQNQAIVVVARDSP